MSHLTPDELIDAAEGTLDAERLRHLDVCEACRREVDALRALQREVAAVPVPEPSPLFWDHLSARVSGAVAEEPNPTRWSGLWRWPVLLPLGALAAVVIALAETLSRPDDVVVLPMTMAIDDTAPIPDPSTTEEDWVVVADLVAPLDWDDAGQAGLALEPGDVELAVSRLTTEEQEELHRLIAAELARPSS